MRDQESGEKEESLAAEMPEMGAAPEGAWAAVMAEARDVAEEKDPADVGNCTASDQGTRGYYVRRGMGGAYRFGRGMGPCGRGQAYGKGFGRAGMAPARGNVPPFNAPPIKAVDELSMLKAQVERALGLFDGLTLDGMRIDHGRSHITMA